MLDKIDITNLSDDQLDCVIDELKTRVSLRAKNETLVGHLWKLVRAVGRLLDDKYSEGDQAVRNQLWSDMHRTADNAREYLETLKDTSQTTQPKEDARQ